MVMLKMTGRRRSSTAVTIRTVAEQAGVSMMTVSNVINGTGKVSDQTRARVRQAIRNTGYVPNYEARRLASGGCSRIALLYSDQQTSFPGASPSGCDQCQHSLRGLPIYQIHMKLDGGGGTTN